MNDLEFARHVSVPISQLYAEAKRSRRQFPRNTLIATRSLASLCCDLLRQEGAQDGVTDWPNGLDEKIRLLDRARRINRDTRERLDQLRRWGNGAAHPEDSLFDDARCEALAGQALAAALELLDTAFRQKNGGAALPRYEIVDEQQYELADACYRALMDNNPADQYQVAMHLRGQVAARIAAIKTQAGNDDDAELQLYHLRFELQAHEERALDLLRYASDGDHPAACYQYGLALSEGSRGEDKIIYGVNLIARAGHDGNIDALAWCGRAALFGLHDEPIDHARARDCLERASAEDHPLALTLLAHIYRDGLGVPPDARTAFDLTLRAADAGYANAQFSAAVALIKGEGVEEDEAQAFIWLRRASDAGLPEAQYTLARSIRDGDVPGDTGEVERLLLGAARTMNVAHLDLAEVYMEQPDPARWLEAAGMVQFAYEHALAAQDTALAERCRAAAPPLLARLEAAQPAMRDDVANSFVLTRFLFDERRHPYPNREARTRRMMEIVRELASVRGSGAPAEHRLLRELGSNMGGAARQAPALQRPAMSPHPLQRQSHKTGRNDDCPCGSGKKFKRCCA